MDSTSKPASAATTATATAKRVPPPRLFQAPTPASPIPSDSPSSAGTTKHIPLSQLRSPRGSVDLAAGVTASNPSSNVPPAPPRNAAGIAEENRVDALWAKMQLTLEEVELSALGSTHIFGTAHNAALEELRDAQIALAKAWGRGEADEEFEAMDAAWANDQDTMGTAEEGQNLDGGGGGGVDGEQENTEAKRRREANDKFFKKVNDGVVDVVGKLDGVAAAMAKVEKESREIWDDQATVDGSSQTS